MGECAFSGWDGMRARALLLLYSSFRRPLAVRPPAGAPCYRRPMSSLSPCLSVCPHPLPLYDQSACSSTPHGLLTTLSHTALLNIFRSVDYV